MAQPPNSIADQKMQQTLESLISKTRDIQLSIISLIEHIEHHPDVQWPEVLDSYAVIANHMKTLDSFLQNSDKCPPLKDYVLMVSHLARSGQIDNMTSVLPQITESRLFELSGRNLPFYLRTKPEPVVENTDQQLFGFLVSASQHTGGKHNPEALNKQIVVQNKSCKSILDGANKDVFKESDQDAPPLTFDESDSITLINAVQRGIGLPPGKEPTALSPSQPQMQSGVRYTAARPSGKPMNPYQQQR